MRPIVPLTAWIAAVALMTLCWACDDADPVRLTPDGAVTAHDAGADDAAIRDAMPDGQPGCTAPVPVPVRVHRVRADDESLNATWTDDEVGARVAEAADFWRTHCLAVELEDVVDTPAQPAGVDAFRAATANPPVDRMRLRAALSALVPREALLTPGWNVFAIHDFNAPAVGVYVPDPGVLSVFVAQERPDGTPLGRFILAHELGHSLSLQHYVGDGRDANLMRDDPDRLVEPVTLTESQVDGATVQARAGAPFAPQGP